MWEIINEVFNQYGFPIAMVVYFIYEKNTTTKSLIATIDNNTKAINKFGCVMSKLVATLIKEKIISSDEELELELNSGEEEKEGL